MAGVDKLYGTMEQYEELKAWLKKNKRYYLRYMFRLCDMDLEGVEEFSLGNFGGNPMKWLSQNCPIEWVKEQCLENMDMCERLSQWFRASLQ